jgi:ribosomal protein L16 Arg81 hydroxylase
MDKMLDEDEVAKEIKQVSAHADKNQRLAWRRKKARIDTLIERIQPLQDKKLEIILQMQPIMDEIEAVRQEMVKECIHPKDHLVHKGTHIECKFCKSKLKVNGV